MRKLRHVSSSEFSKFLNYLDVFFFFVKHTRKIFVNPDNPLTLRAASNSDFFANIFDQNAFIQFACWC